MNSWEAKPVGWSSLLPTLLLAAMVGVVVVQRGLGFLLVILVPVVALWAAWALYASRGWHERTQWAWRKIGVWALVLGACGLVHWRYSVGARDVGDTIVRAVTRYQEATGRYPDSLAEAGLDPAFARRGRAVYVKDPAGVPQLMYMATFEMMSTYSYDFQARRWQFNAD